MSGPAQARQVVVLGSTGSIGTQALDVVERSGGRFRVVGLAVELYRRGGFRADLLAERCSVIVGIDARLAEIEELLHARRNVARCECGAPRLRGSKFCPNCGRELDKDPSSNEATIIERT